ncbi:hypothetical protein OG866_09075 [Streptomyces sp. NBC_00663]|uniref:hypothetical protein n=1 Tax=Streptomyces sp. NBC_00663 TaxID=2975801 RepID=UPI002E3546FC|nr:hypothetical protein [Streptomyces sp. NBC_00663]
MKAVFDEEIARTIGCLDRVPARYRRFSEHSDKALRFHRIPESVLERLLDGGMPHAKSAGAIMFDVNDLKTVVLRLGIASPQHTALKAMADALKRAARQKETRCTVNILGRCVGPTHDGPCAYGLSGRVRESPYVQELRELAPQHFEATVRLPAGDPFHFDLSPAGRRLVTEVLSFEFHHIPDALTRDLTFLADAGISDCRLATHFLYTRGKELGLDIRKAAGIFLSRPFSNTHCWIEFKASGEWRPADPFFLTALSRWGILDPAEWPVHRSPEGAYWKLSTELESYVTHQGVGQLPSFLTR